MSDQPKKQELPPIPELPFELGHVEALGWELGHRRSQLLAALSGNEALRADNEAKDARIVELEAALHERNNRGTGFLYVPKAAHDALAAKLKSVEGLARRTKLKKVAIDCDGEEYVPSKGEGALYYNADPVDALLARIREAIK